MQPHGLMFHHFHDQHRHAPGQGSMSAEQLRALIEHVGPRRILPARQFLDRAIAGNLSSGDICLTFDDNLRCQFDVAVPVLREFGLTAFFFVYTSVLQGGIERLEIYRHFRMTRFDSVDAFYSAFLANLMQSPWAGHAERALDTFVPAKYLAEFPFYTNNDRQFRFVRDEVLGPQHYNQLMDTMVTSFGDDPRAIASGLWMDDACLRELDQQGHVIGLHSHTHPTRLQRLDESSQRYEYQANCRHLQRLLGEKPLAMSHPCNSYDATTLQILHGLGIRLGFRANMTPMSHGPLELPREDHANLLTRMEIAA